MSVSLKDFPTCEKCLNRIDAGEELAIQHCWAKRQRNVCPKDLWKETFEKWLNKKELNFIKRWSKTPYPHTDLDALTLQAGIGLIKEILGVEEKH